jgi:glycosyltransferase involved in cell wall biosynthesis
MRLLFLTQYFPPEISAPSARVSELCRYWASNGVQATVVTAFPNHPKGVIPPAYRGKLVSLEEVDGYRVLRSWIYPAANRGFFKRLVCFLSFFFSSIASGTLRGGPCDLVIATSPQMFVGLSGWFVSLFKGVPFVIEVRDLWPESAIELGILRNRVLVKLSKGLERFLYRHASLVVAVSQSIRRAILEEGVPDERVLVLPNGIDRSLFFPASRHNEKRAELGLKDEFVVSYIGTHGMAHGLEVVVDAANILKDNPNIRFLFMGEGAQREVVMDYSRSLGLNNVTFLNSQPRAEVPLWYSASDLCLVVLKDLPVFRTVLPSKMFEIMASERPLLIVANGECAELVENSGAGLVVPPEDPQRLAGAILKLATSRSVCRGLAEAGRHFVLEHFDREKLSAIYLERLEQLTKKNGANPE